MALDIADRVLARRLDYLSASVGASLYLLWLCGRRLAPMGCDTNTFLDAVLMLSTAHYHFGYVVHEWSMQEVNEIGLKGREGMGEPVPYTKGWDVWRSCFLRCGGRCAHVRSVIVSRLPTD